MFKTKSEIAAAMYVILTALAAAKTTSVLKGVPNGDLYAQLMEHFDIEKWTALIACMVDSQLITNTHHLLRITSKGEDLLAQLAAIYKEAASNELTTKN